MLYIQMMNSRHVLDDLGFKWISVWVTQHNQIILYNYCGRLSDVCELYYDEGPKGTYLFPKHDALDPTFRCCVSYGFEVKF